MTPRAACLGLLLACAAAPGASASTASVETVYRSNNDYHRPIEYFEATFEYNAAAGEDNAVVVADSDAPGSTKPAVTFSDPGAEIKAGPGCTALSPHEVRCEAAPPPGFCDCFTYSDAGADVRLGDGRDALHSRASFARVELGAGDDTAGAAPDVAFARIEARGGPGADTLTGGAGNAHLHGGDGNDTLRGGAGADSLEGGEGVDALDGAAAEDLLVGGNGADQLQGGEGDDTLDESRTLVAGDSAAADGASDRLDGGPGRDRLDGGGGDDQLAGGEGPDLVDYGSRRGALEVDLVAGSALTRSGEHDRLGGVEWVQAGSGNDVLVGDAAANRLSGGDGRNRIVGGGGDDYLEGGAGDDIEAGDGDDRIVLGNADERDRVSCGAGRDAVGFPDGHDLLPSECESAYIVEDPDAFGESGLDVDGLAELLLAVRTDAAAGKRRAFLRVRCLDLTACRGRLTLRTPRSHDPVGRSRFRIPPRRTRRVAVPLSKSARKRLARAPLRVEVGAVLLARSSYDDAVYQQDGYFLLSLAS